MCVKLGKVKKNYGVNLTQQTAFLWPAKSRWVFQPDLSMIWAVGPPPFMAWADTRNAPSGDQSSLERSKILNVHFKLELARA